MNRLFKSGRIARGDAPQLAEGDVRVEHGRITAVGALSANEGETVIDCTGKILVPALFDARAHLREPGREDKETIASGSQAAIHGGFTGIVAMPNTDPPIDTAAMIRFSRSIAREVSPIPVFPAGCLSKGRKGQELAEIGDMQEKGAVLITDDDRPVADPYLLRRALEYARDLGMPIGCHGEVPELSAGGAMHEGRMSYKLGMSGIPSCSEEIGIERDLRIARYTGAAVHIHHVSTADGMETIRRYKNDGVAVTCEVAPHHLIFCDEDIENYNTHFKVNPPLRSAEDRERLVDGLVEGLFDVIATDHAPHTVFEKDLDFAHAPFGITGLETALLSLYDRFIEPGRFGWDVVVRHFSEQPRKLFHQPAVPIAEGTAAGDRPAEFIVFDPDARTLVDRSWLCSKSVNTPFLDQELKGAIEQVVFGDLLLLKEP